MLKSLVFQLILFLIAFLKVKAYPLVGPCTDGRVCKQVAECPREFELAIRKQYSKLQFCGLMLSDTDVCCEESGIRKLKLINNPEVCGLTTSDRIKDGEVAQLNQFPWLVLLKYRSNDGETESFQCGGTLISNRYVLTAAHCRSPATSKLFSVRLGEHSIIKSPDCRQVGNKQMCNPPHQDIDIELFIEHEKYNSQSKLNDIALIRLSRPVELSKERIRHIRTICLPVKDFHQIGYKKKPKKRQTEESDYYGGLFSKENKHKDEDDVEDEDDEDDDKNDDKLTVAGWGQTESALFSDVPRFAALDYQTNDQCVAYFIEKKKKRNNQYIKSDVHETQMCAGGTVAADACKGDSGSALMRLAKLHKGDGYERTFQYGIVSYGVNCKANETFPGVFTRVSSYINWILDHMEN